MKRQARRKGENWSDFLFVLQNADVAARANSEPDWQLEKRRLWRAGGEAGPNVLQVFLFECETVLFSLILFGFQDSTHGSEFLNEAQGALCASFIKACHNGPLCGEPLHGVVFSVTDVKVC